MISIYIAYILQYIKSENSYVLLNILEYSQNVLFYVFYAFLFVYIIQFKHVFKSTPSAEAHNCWFRHVQLLIVVAPVII